MSNIGYLGKGDCDFGLGVGMSDVTIREIMEGGFERREAHNRFSAIFRKSGENRGKTPFTGA